MIFFSCGKLGEVTENIPIFARVSRTQTQTNTQPNMHSTHNPSSITRNPAAEMHKTFSSKERDVETDGTMKLSRCYAVTVTEILVKVLSSYATTPFNV